MSSQTENLLLRLPQPVLRIVLLYLSPEDAHAICMLLSSFLAATASLILEFPSSDRPSMPLHGLKVLHALSHPDFRKSQLRELVVIGKSGGALHQPLLRHQLSGCKNLQSLETNDTSVLQYMPPGITTLCVPANARIDSTKFESLQVLTMYDAYIRTPHIIPYLPDLWRLSLEIDNSRCCVGTRVDLDDLPNLEELYLVAPRTRTSANVCIGISKSISKLVMTGGFEFPSTAKFSTFLHRLGTDNIDRLSLKDLLISYPSDAADLPLMFGLRSFECIGMDPIFLSQMSCFGLRKLLVESRRVLPTEVITEILKAARLVSFSLVTHPYPPSAKSRYTAETIRTLCLNRDLKHFQSIGPYFFADHDWKTLHIAMKRLQLFHVVHPARTTSRERLQYPSSSQIKELQRTFLRVSDKEGDFAISQDLVPQPLVFDTSLRRVRRRLISRRRAV